MTRGVSVVVLACVACTSHTVVKPGQYPSFIGDGNTYELATRSGYRDKVYVTGVDPYGSVIVQREAGGSFVIPRNDVPTFRRTSHGMGFWYGFLGTTAAITAMGLVAGLSADEDNCDFACSPAAVTSIFFAVGVSTGLFIGGPIGAIVGKDYVYEVTP